MKTAEKDFPFPRFLLYNAVYEIESILVNIVAPAIFSLALAEPVTICILDSLSNMNSWRLQSVMKNRRIERVAENMRRQGLPQILVSDPSSIYYLTGFMQHPGERLFALLLNDTGRAVLYANRLFAADPSKLPVKLIEYGDTDDSAAILADGISGGVLGVDKFFPSGFLIKLMDARGDLVLKQGSAPVDDARMRKDEEEIRALRESSALNDRVLGEVIGMLNIGQRETEVAGLYQATADGLNAQSVSFPPLVCFGPNCAQPHHISDGTVLKHGDSVILDVGVTVDGYASDMTRTVFMGSATDEQKRVYELVRAANAKAAAAVRPGVLLRDIDRAARKVIEDAGYGDKFLHRTGHGLGITCHEPPDVSGTSDAVCVPGMVFSIEPGIYLKDSFGVRIEDLALVTEDGCEILNNLFRELIIL